MKGSSGKKAANSIRGSISSQSSSCFRYSVVYCILAISGVLLFRIYIRHSTPSQHLISKISAFNPLTSEEAFNEVQQENLPSSSAWVDYDPALGAVGGSAQNSRRLLFMAASYSWDQFLYLQKTVDSMRDICNSGWNVTIHLQVAYELSYNHERYLDIKERAFCMTTGQYIPILIESFGKIGFGLNSRHRIYMRDHLDEFDYFSYAEEDMLLTVSHLEAFRAAQQDIMKALPDYWKYFTIGFLRLE